MLFHTLKSRKEIFSVAPFNNSSNMSRSRSPSRESNREERSRSRSRSPRRDERSVSRSRSRSERRHESRREDDRHERRRDRSPDERTESTSVLVRKLSYRTTVDELKRPFLEFGEVTDVYIPQDYHTRRPRGFGFVKFAREDDANAAIRAMDGADIDGAKVEVVLAKQSRKSPRTMRRMSHNDRPGRRDYDDDRRGGYGYRESRRRSRSYSRGREDRHERRRY
jgi:RNA recognition motif-containing protein